MTFLAELRELVELESPTEDLSACNAVISLAAEIIKRHLPGEVAINQIEGRPTLYWGAKQPKVLLLCHLDTVWPKGSFEPVWREANGAIHAPGIFDMKAGFLQAVYAASQINDCDLQIALLATSDEETGSSASKALIKELAASAPYVLVFESALDGQVKIGRKGTAMYHITVHGKAAHAGLEPEKGINASIEMAALILQVAKLGDPINGTTVVPTTAKSGTTTNTVPAMASFDVDIRSFSAAELIRVDGAIHALRAQDGASRVEITGGINRPPLEESSTRELFHLLQECGRELGMPEIGGVSVGGASDGNFAAAAGAKVLDGIGAVGAGAHADHEHLLVDSIEPRIALTTALLRKLVS